MGQACRQLKAWQGEGFFLRGMAVNISAPEFRDEHFLESVFAILDESGIDPRLLELELTEGLLTTEARSTSGILPSLKARGVRLAIDDFGTGHSSLSYLSRFTLDTLKIDQSFIRQIAGGGDGTTLVSALIGVARSLNIKVVAEGVETGAELDFPVSHHCDVAQGFLFSSPLPPEQFAVLLADEASAALEESERSSHTLALASL